MATEDLLPFFHPDGGGGKNPEVDLETLLAQDSTLQDDLLLSEILGSEGDGLLSLLAPTDTETAFAPMNFDLSTSPVIHSPTASEGYTSDCSATIRVPSPSSHSSVSDQWGDSPSCPTLPDSQYALGNTVQDRLQPSDVSIDVDLMFCDAVSTSGASTSQELTDGGGKAATLVLTEEEKLLMAQEGIELPMDLPLTKAEQQQLKRIRRKIKNKVSAQESRKRKKEYVEGLEKRVEHCTTVNRKLQKKVSTLETENHSLLTQLRKLQAMVTEYNPSRMQAGSLLLVVILSFSLFFAPWLRTSPPQGGGDYQSIRAHSSRVLLFAETDEFGNVIDPETGRVISEAGGQSPLPPPPWVHQTPAIHHLPKPLEYSHHQKLKNDL